jgi:hypothetical protein
LRGSDRGASPPDAAWEDPRMSVAENAVAERLEGGQPGRLRAVLAAIAIGAAVAVVAYRLLRSSSRE